MHINHDVKVMIKWSIMMIKWLLTAQKSLKITCDKILISLKIAVRDLIRKKLITTSISMICPIKIIKIFNLTYNFYIDKFLIGLNKF